ncbi:MAG: hypothetical protein SVU32_09575 [Candidatus Nanohaloarchaea archaeon]|nr:hypothetical protein [Candidatus Nanohaloarchaea archaeon]
MIPVQVDLPERTATIGEEDITLSNHNIKHIREHADTSINSQTVSNVLQQLIDSQITPFLSEAGRPINQETIEQEVREAFDTHLYLLTKPD